MGVRPAIPFAVFAGSLWLWAPACGDPPHASPPALDGGTDAPREAALPDASRRGTHDASADADAGGDLVLSYAGLSGEVSGSCSQPYRVLVALPAGPGSYPLYVHVVGTGEPYDDGYARSLLSYMASRGFVAASIEYPNTSDTGCVALKNKSACMFGGANEKSALAALCALPLADCDKGIGISGISQGSQIAAIAAGFDPRFRAAYAISSGDVLVAGRVTLDMQRCMDGEPIGTRVLPNDRIRVVDGEFDQFFGVVPDAGQSPAFVRTALTRLTGLPGCGEGTFSCTRSNGSGWYELQGFELLSTNDEANHFYVNDPGYRVPFTFAWSFIPNLDWLASVVTGQPSSGYLQFSYGAFTASASAGFAVIRVNRTAGAAGDATAHYESVDVTARAGTDYGTVSGELTFPDGEFDDLAFMVPLEQSAAGKTLKLQLSRVNGAFPGTPGEVLLTVTP